MRLLPVALLLLTAGVVANAAAGENELASKPVEKKTNPGGAIAPTGVNGNTLCLNATAADTDVTLHIESVFGKGAVESPSDTVYTPARPHVLSVTGDDKSGPYFAILAMEPGDVNLDGVPLAKGGDRSRTEIKIAPGKVGVQAGFQAHRGDTFVYAWRFRIEPGMKFSPSFTHIHQIKAYGGAYAEPPLITFTPLANGQMNGQMEVRHVGDKKRDSSSAAVLGAMPLEGVAGQWMEVREEITFSNTAGRYRLDILDATGKTRLSIDRRDLEMWRDGADHMRPKWGIYRKHHAALNQDGVDKIAFANLAITRGSEPSSSCR